VGDLALMGPVGPHRPHLPGAVIVVAADEGDPAPVGRPGGLKVEDGIVRKPGWVAPSGRNREDLFLPSLRLLGVGDQPIGTRIGPPRGRRGREQGEDGPDY
jgi:hypothetical protein